MRERSVEEPRRTALRLERLGRDGFLLLPDAFAPEDVRAVARVLDAVFDAEVRGRGGKTRGTAVHEVLRPSRRCRSLRRSALFAGCLEVARSLLGGRARLAFDHALYKEPAEDSAVPWHQDQAYQTLDRRMRSIHFWIPLHAFPPEAGGLEFAPGSHRGGVLPHDRDADSGRLQAGRPWEGAVVPGVLGVGACSVHLPRTLHRSGPNRSNMVRKAWILHFSRYGKLETLRPENLGSHLAVVLRGLRRR